MQLKQIFIAGLLAVITLASCSKNNDDIIAKPEFTIEGNWEGKYSFLSEPFNNYYSFTLKAGGVLEVKNVLGGKTGQGTWAFYNNNTAITGTYSLLPPSTATFSIIANFDKVNGKLDGTWGNGQNDYNGGYWFMNKIN